MRILQELSMLLNCGFYRMARIVLSELFVKNLEF
jgi:hypothetical protein